MKIYYIFYLTLSALFLFGIYKCNTPTDNINEWIIEDISVAYSKDLGFEYKVCQNNNKGYLFTDRCTYFTSVDTLQINQILKFK